MLESNFEAHKICEELIISRHVRERSIVWYKIKNIEMLTHAYKGDDNTLLAKKKKNTNKQT